MWGRKGCFSREVRGKNLGFGDKSWVNFVPFSQKSGEIIQKVYINLYIAEYTILIVVYLHLYAYHWIAIYIEDVHSTWLLISSVPDGIFYFGDAFALEVLNICLLSHFFIK